MPLLGGAAKMAGAAVPAGGPRFTGDPYFISDFYVYGFGDPVRVFAGFEIDADGGIEGIKRTGNIGDVGRWDNNLGTLSKVDYQFRFDTDDVIPGPGSTSDDFNVWLPASAFLQSFYIEIEFNGDFTTVGTIRVRDASTLVEYDSASMSMTVAQEP